MVNIKSPGQGQASWEANNKSYVFTKWPCQSVVFPPEWSSHYYFLNALKGKEEQMFQPWELFSRLHLVQKCIMKALLSQVQLEMMASSLAVHLQELGTGGYLCWKCPSHLRLLTYFYGEDLYNHTGGCEMLIYSLAEYDVPENMQRG